MTKVKEEMVENSVKAINAYCRVLELQIKAIAQGIMVPKPNEPLNRAITAAQEGLAREVEFLSFLRAEHEGRGSPES